MPRRGKERDEEIRRLKSELWETRMALIGMAHAVEAHQLLTSYYDCKVGSDIFKWQSLTIDKVLEGVSPKPAQEMGDYSSSTDRAYCPLCRMGADSAPGVEGFAYPVGMRRHLEGSYNSQQCFVMKAAIALAREHVDDLSDPTTPKLGSVK